MGHIEKLYFGTYSAAILKTMHCRFYNQTFIMYSTGILRHLRHQFYAQIAAEVQWEIWTQLKVVFLARPVMENRQIRYNKIPE